MDYADLLYDSLILIMIELYITSIDKINENSINKISPARAEKALKYRQKDDKLRCIAGGLFINKFLGDTKIVTNRFGKPLSENGIYFNLSHSGKYVIFAVSDNPVGCDIEQQREVKIDRISKSVFCENEINLLNKADNKQDSFFSIWTGKESLLKCIGEGFHRKASSVDTTQSPFVDNNTSYYIHTFTYDEYSISVCSTLNTLPNKAVYILL